MRRMEVEASGQIVITPELVKEYLGAPRYLRMAVLKAPETGVVNALAWTPSAARRCRWRRWPSPETARWT